MFVTNHVLAGAAVGRLIRAPLPAFVLGIASHFAMDAAPHWSSYGDDALFDRVAVRDGLIGLATLGAVAVLSHRDDRAAVLAGAAGAVLPDLHHPFKKALGRPLWPRWVNEFHSRIQRESPQGGICEVAIGAVGALVVAALLRHEPSRHNGRQR